jgi:outer membrane lipoprotein-sorting protein
MVALFLCSGLNVGADDELLDRWFAAQAKIETWSANVTQTRTLKALKDPLTTDGRVWFSAPNRFRWELGEPARTVAVRSGDTMSILYPLLKRAERYPLDESASGPWRDALTLLEAGFPRDRETLERQFELGAIEDGGEPVKLTLMPRSQNARKLISKVVIEFGRDSLNLHATELSFADGSKMRNDFRDAVINPPLEASLFSPAIPVDFKVTEPAAGRGK